MTLTLQEPTTQKHLHLDSADMGVGPVQLIWPVQQQKKSVDKSSTPISDICCDTFCHYGTFCH